MRKLTRLLLLLFLGGAVTAGVTSCSNDDTEPAAPAELTLSSATVAAPNTASHQKVAYTLTNPVEGTSVTLTVQNNADWITNLKDSANTVVFDVAANTDDTQRTATINVAYGEGIQKTIKVTQAADPSAFETSVGEITKLSANISIMPKDDATEYLVLPLTKTEAETFGSTPEDVANSYLQSLQEVADSYQMSLYDLLTQVGYLIKGDKQETFYGYPGTEYNVYVFGLSTDGTVATPVSTLNFTLNSVDKISTTFDLKAAANGTSVNISAKPSDKSQLYFVNAMVKTTYNAYENPVQEGINSIAQSYNVTPAEVVKELGSKGDYTDTFTGLKANTTYVLFAAAVDADGAVISDPVTYEFTTGDAKKSDNQITINVSDITNTTAKVSVTTTNNDPYTLALYQGDLKDASDADLVGDLVQSADQLGIHNGSISGTFGTATPLTPGTTYTVAAVGVDGGVATQDKPVRFTFTTTGTATASTRIQHRLSKAQRLFDVKLRSGRKHHTFKLVPLTFNKLNRLLK